MYIDKTKQYVESSSHSLKTPTHPVKLYHFIWFLFESTNYGGNKEWFLDPKSIMNKW